MALYLGFDTSNYTTSAAVYDAETGRYHNQGKLLSVPQGQLGLRQSDAVFAHLKALPEIVEGLSAFPLKDVRAIGVSTRPRSVEGSYMPCFTAGATTARVLAQTLDVPCYAVSHQDGHIAAVLCAAGRLELGQAPLLAWHLSGGTTELVLVKPGEDAAFQIEKIGGTTDISAGQLIDRTGVALGLRFPAGKELDKLAESSAATERYPVKLNGLYFSLSGMENKARQKQEQGQAAGDIARFVLATVADAVVRATRTAQEQCGPLPVLLSGGVAGNRMLRAAMEPFFPICAPPEYSSDNALGAAVLAAIRRERGAKA